MSDYSGGSAGRRLPSTPDSRICPPRWSSRPSGGCWTRSRCAIGALDEPAPQIARRVAARIQGNPSATLIGGGQSAPDWAAFANGVHIRYLDCNDTYLSLEPAHPSDNWAAVMAAGEARRSQRRGLDHGRGRRLRGPVPALRRRQHPRPRLGPHDLRLDLGDPGRGQAAGALDHDQTVHALGIAGTTGTALRLTRAGELSMWKGCAFAFAARNGVFAALLAADGHDRPRAPLRRRDGVLPAGFRPVSICPSWAGRPPPTGCCPKTSIKFVPAEYHSQSAIAAAFELRPEIGDPRRIRSIEIATFRTAVEIIGKDPEKWRPRTRETADHSLPYCTAVALVDGEISAAQFTPERLNDPALIDLISRTTVIEDPSLTAGYPAAVPNRVTVTLADGTVLVRELSHPPGHDQEPAHRCPACRQVPRPGRPDPGPRTSRRDPRTDLRTRV